MPVMNEDMLSELTATSPVQLRHGVSVVRGDASQEGTHLYLELTRHIPQSLFDRYRSEALKHAEIRQLEDATFYAEIPEFPGVWANESNPLTCLTILDEVLTDWLLLKIEHQDRDIPVITDIDLNPIAQFVALPRQTSWEELVRKFKALGWTGPTYGTKHPFMNKEKRRQRIPNPHASDIGAPLLAEILRQARISKDDWEREKAQRDSLFGEHGYDPDCLNNPVKF